MVGQTASAICSLFIYLHLRITFGIKGPHVEGAKWVGGSGSVVDTGEPVRWLFQLLFVYPSAGRPAFDRGKTGAAEECGRTKGPPGTLPRAPPKDKRNCLANRISILLPSSTKICPSSIAGAGLRRTSGAGRADTEGRQIFPYPED